MGVSLDLRKAHSHHRYGELVAIFTWVNDERALVLLPALRKGAPWFIVCESAAWKWDPDGETMVDTGGRPIAGKGYVVAQARKAAQVLGMDHGTTWLKLAAIITEGLPDLVRMPAAPMPSYLKSEFGRMQLKADGKVIAEEAIRLESDGAEYTPNPAQVH